MTDKTVIPLKAYMAYDRIAGSEGGAILVFAHNSKEAKRVSYPTVNSCFDSAWTDAAVRLIRNEQIYDQANTDKMNDGIPHVIEDPIACIDCHQWGHPMMESGRCEGCEEVHFTQKI